MPPEQDFSESMPDISSKFSQDEKVNTPQNNEHDESEARITFPFSDSDISDDELEKIENSVRNPQGSAAQTTRVRSKSC